VLIGRLPRLSAVGDNAVMQNEPSKAEPPKRKRRRFQFSLRTLLIGVAVRRHANGDLVRLMSDGRSVSRPSA
jgi:hypothetical protein